MDQLGVPRGGRRRALSINTVSGQQQNAMNNALDSLQDDLDYVGSQWNKIITKNSNPLELALSFLDDTSVGLGHKYDEFQQLKKRLGYDLQQTVNEHYQAFNSNVASYSIAVSSITEAQDNVIHLHEFLKEANNNISADKGQLQELNDRSVDCNNSIEILSCIESILESHEKIEEYIRKEEYIEVKACLVHCFQQANANDLWSIKSLLPLKQQLEVQEHTLFTSIMEEIHDILYSRKTMFPYMSEIIKTTDMSQLDFTSLENYLNNTVNIDISKKSTFAANVLDKFLNKLSSTETSSSLQIHKNGQLGEGFERLFSLLQVLYDLNKLPMAINIIIDRAKTETHEMVVSSTEKFRSKHPSLIKVASSMISENSYGIPIKDMLSAVMREFFWEIFLKLLVTIQCHRTIYETISTIQDNGANLSSSCRLNKMWNVVFKEVESVLSKYLENPFVNLLQETENANLTSSINSKKGSKQIFALQNNIEDDIGSKNYANELKMLLKDIFPDITLSSSADLKSIFVEEETIEYEEALVPASAFNMKFVLEPFLLFSKATSDLLPDLYQSKCVSSMDFFNNYMETKYYAQLEMTFSYLFQVRVAANNPFALDTTEDNQHILKAAIDFRDLFYDIIYITNSTHSFRSKLCPALIAMLKTFSVYYDKVFSSLLGTTTNKFHEKVVALWIQDENLMHLEKAIYEGNKDKIATEAELLLSKYPQFYDAKKRLRNTDLMSTVAFEQLVDFLGTLSWIIGWLPKLRRVVDLPEKKSNDLDANSLRNEWYFFETGEFITGNKIGQLKLTLNNIQVQKFDTLVFHFKLLKQKIVSALRLEKRSKCLYYIGRYFQNTRMWNLATSSVELNQNIAALISDLKMGENKLKQEIPRAEIDIIFAGIDVYINRLFVSASECIPAINKNGIKNMLKNISMLQNTCRNLMSDPAKINMTMSLKFYSLCEGDENTLFQQIQAGALTFLTFEDLKGILRLQFGEEIGNQMNKSKAAMEKRVSVPTNKRYHDALRKLDDLAAHS